MKNLFSSRLTEILKETKISQRRLAREIGVSAMSISDWTKGNVQPTAENIFLIAEYFQTSADYLLGLEDESGTKTYNNTYNNFGTHQGDVKF